MNRRQFIAVLGIVAGGAGLLHGQTLIGGSARFGSLPQRVGGGAAASRPAPKAYPLDDMEDYSAGSTVDGLNGGWNWGGTLSDHSAFGGVQAIDSLETYVAGATVDGLNGGSGWGGSISDHTPA